MAENFKLHCNVAMDSKEYDHFKFHCSASQSFHGAFDD